MAVLGYRIPYRPATGLPAAFRAAGALGLVVAVFVAAQAASTALRLPVPGSVLGLIALAVALVARPRAAAPFAAAEPLLRALPLLFVPLLVGAADETARLGPVLVPVLTVVALAGGAAALATALTAGGVAWICSRSR